MEPKENEKWFWKGKIRIVLRYYPLIRVVYFTDGTSARFSSNMKKEE